MARSRTLKERTVAFYEVVEEKAGEQQRISELPWADTLAALATANVDERTYDAESVFVGNVVTVDEDDHLLLHRVKGATEWLSVLNWETGEWRELESRAREGYLDTSVMSFLPFGNIVGIIQGSTAAPTHRSLESWINGLHLFPETGVPPGHARAEDRRALLDDLRDIEEVVPGVAERARATLVYAEASGPEYRRLVELVEHHITAKRRVAAVDKEGRSIRILSAVTAIMGVAAEHEEELRLAADVS